MTRDRPRRIERTPKTALDMEEVGSRERDAVPIRRQSGDAGVPHGSKSCTCFCAFLHVLVYFVREIKLVFITLTNHFPHHITTSPLCACLGLVLVLDVVQAHILILTLKQWDVVRVGARATGR